MLDYGTISIRLALAIALGGVLGLERELRNQPAGFRTHIVLCVGSALFTMLSSHMAQVWGGNADPTRIAAQVVVGVGFLGAGAIFRLGVSVKGLTTAANLWTTAGIGMAVGTGFYFGAVLATAIILVALTLFRGLEVILLLGKTDRSLSLTARPVPDLFGRVESILNGYGATIKSIKMNRGEDGRFMEVQAIVEIPKGAKLKDITSGLASSEDILEVEIL